MGLVRQVLKNGSVAYSDSDIEYLRKFGEWEDIPLIVTSVKRAQGAPKLLYNLDEHKYKVATYAIYYVGKARLAELITLEMPNQLLARLIIEIPDKSFRLLSDASLKPLLHSEDDKVRKATALKCVRALPKQRVKRILHDYTSGDTSGETRQYYNVIHWLDLGASAPRDTALRAAQKVIST